MSPPSAPYRPLARPEDLWPRTVETTRHGLATGALQPITTDCRVIEQEGVPFQARVLGRVKLKEDRQREKVDGAPFNPFENPEPELVVGGISPTHLCVLNKFNVVEHHLLLITRAFEAQESPLTAADFEALAFGLAGLDGLAFYNSGETAGASQRHRHLQLIPPLGPDGLRAPMEKLLPPPPPPGRLTPVPALGFAHALTGLGLREVPPGEAAARLQAAYQALREALGLHAPEPPPYNLLATRDWMLLVPRARAASHDINLNAMGFAGSLLVKTEEQLRRVRAVGPMTLLREVALPSPPPGARWPMPP